MGCEGEWLPCVPDESGACGMSLRGDTRVLAHIKKLVGIQLRQKAFDRVGVQSNVVARAECYNFAQRSDGLACIVSTQHLYSCLARTHYHPKM